MINDRMPEYCVQRAARILNWFRKPLNGSRIFLLGVAYKQDLHDYREGLAIEVVMHLESAGVAVVYYDPYVSEISDHGGLKQGLPTLYPALIQSVDLVIVASAHSNVDYGMVQTNARVVFDTKNAMKDVSNRSNIVLL